jgi:hypothetical protein
MLAVRRGYHNAGNCAAYRCNPGESGEREPQFSVPVRQRVKAIGCRSPSLRETLGAATPLYILKFSNVTILPIFPDRTCEETSR